MNAKIEIQKAIYLCEEAIDFLNTAYLNHCKVVAYNDNKTQ